MRGYTRASCMPSTLPFVAALHRLYQVVLAAGAGLVAGPISLGLDVTALPIRLPSAQLPPGRTASCRSSRAACSLRDLHRLTAETAVDFRLPPRIAWLVDAYAELYKRRRRVTNIV